MADRTWGSMKQYVMFGQSGLFGDYADIIEALGGVLKKVVVNVPDPAHPKRPSFEQRLARHNAAQRGRSGAEAIVQRLEDFEPERGEVYVIGFRGPHVQPLSDQLVQSFDLRFETLIHPAAVISPGVEIGEGAIVNAGAVIASHVVLGRYLLINRGASVGHDGRLDEFANIGPGANLASNVHVGRGAAVGIGATVLEDLTIGEYAYVAAGAVVIRDVEPGTLVAGVPAVVKKRSPRSAP
jgi:sugar O-acyltransferase (sialic acid O-acetyltransferase NeuD family)